MTPEQWTTVVSQLGVGGVALLVIIKVIVPMFLGKSAEIVDAMKTMVAAIDRNTAATNQLAERVARLEGARDFSDRHTPVEVPIVDTRYSHKKGTVPR